MTHDVSHGDDEQLDLVWGIKGIGEFIDKPPRETHYLLSTGKIPARQVGMQWVASKGQLRAFFLRGAH